MKEKTKMAGFKGLPTGEGQCIWMEAGVIDYKLCNQNFNCHTCPFDKAMKEVADKNAQERRPGLGSMGKKAQIVPWQEKMKRWPGTTRECRHTLTGRAPLRLCPYEYQCHKCQFDQILEDGWELQIPYQLTRIPEVDGYLLPEGHFFHAGHTWARDEHGGRIRVGVDDFSMRLFGPVDKFDLPLTGEQIRSSEIGLAFNRTGRTLFYIEKARLACAGALRI